MMLTLSQELDFTITKKNIFFVFLQQGLILHACLFIRQFILLLGQHQGQYRLVIRQFEREKLLEKYPINIIQGSVSGLEMADGM